MLTLDFAYIVYMTVTCEEFGVSGSLAPDH